MAGVTWAEIRNAARSLSRAPTISICAILCLGLGIGATTAISSALSRALLQPLPFHEPERLVAVHRITPQSGPMGGWSQSVPNYIDLRDRSTQVTGLAAVTWGSAIINLPAEAMQASQHYVTGNLFQTLGARAQRGRLLMPDDDRPDAPFAVGNVALGRYGSLKALRRAVGGVNAAGVRVTGASQIAAETYAGGVWDDAVLGGMGLLPFGGLKQSVPDVLAMCF